MDDRIGRSCAYCGGQPSTRDHVPPKVFLDEPYPSNLIVVASCLECNNSRSADEVYVACALELASTPSGDPARIERDVIIRTFDERPALLDRVRLQTLGDGTAIRPEMDRVEMVMGKIATGLWRYETGEEAHDRLPQIRIGVAGEFGSEDLARFKSVDDGGLFPEVGSRMMIRLCESGFRNAWNIVQPGRFEYGVDYARNRVKLLVRDYLAVEVDLVDALGA